MLNHASQEALKLFVAQRGFSDSMLFMGAQTTPQLTASIELANDDGKTRYGFTLAHAAPDSLIYTQETIKCLPAKGVAVSLDLDTGGKESALIKAAQGDPGDPKRQAARFIGDALGKVQPYHFHNTSATARIRNTSDVHASRHLYDDGGNLAAILYTLSQLNEPSYQRIVHATRLAFSAFNDFVLEPEALNPHKIMLKWKGPSPGYTFGPHQLPDGGLRFITLATLLLQPESLRPDVIIIDEPELGLYPHAEQLVCEMLTSASKTSQVLVATQSTTFLDAFAPEDIILAETDDGSTTLTRPSAKDLQEWLEDYSLGELWLKNVLRGRP